VLSVTLHISLHHHHDPCVVLLPYDVEVTLVLREVVISEVTLATGPGELGWRVEITGRQNLHPALLLCIPPPAALLLHLPLLLSTLEVGLRSQEDVHVTIFPQDVPNIHPFHPVLSLATLLDHDCGAASGENRRRQ